MTSDFNLQIRVTAQDLGGFRQDRHGVRTQVRLVEVEVHALQVDGDRHRATVRTDGLTRLRIRALVVAVVDAVTVVIQVCAARGNRRRGNNRGSRRRAQRDHDADRGQHVAEPAFVRSSNALVVEVTAVGHFGADCNALVEGGLQADADLGGEVAVLALTRAVGRREVVVFLFRLLVAQAHQQVRVPATAFGDEVATQVDRGAVLAPVQVLVVVEVRVLVVQLTVQRPVGADELAEAQGNERSVVGQTVAILEVEAGRTGQVPAVIERRLRGGCLGKRQAAQQRGSEDLLVHVIQLLFRGYETGRGMGQHYCVV
ncbi:hypothetical protein D9M71_487670 [compost metagenome]